MLPSDLTEVTADYLATMCREQRPESQRLDFKRALPDARDPQWREEFTKDLCALANTEGGDIVFGISERDACAESVVPITSEPPDASMRRLGQVADARIQPRIVGLQLHTVEVDGGYALVLRVPQSYGGPHGYSVNEVLRFPIRVRTHTTDMSYEQLRTSFDRTATMRERVRAFRQERVQKIIGRQTWRAMPAGPILGMHFVPLQSMAGNDLVDVTALYRRYNEFMFPGWSGGSRSLHLDGLSIYAQPKKENEATSAYTLIFRSGALEVVRSVAATMSNRQLIPGGAVAVHIQDAVKGFLTSARNLGLSGPAIIGAVLADVGPYTFAYDNNEAPARTDRPHLVLPELWIDRAEAVDNPETVWRPIADLLWQCFDLERCAVFDNKRFPS